MPTRVTLAAAPFILTLFTAVLPNIAVAESVPAKIEVPGDNAFTESITATSDGTLYLSSFAAGGVARVKPGATKAEMWIKPGAFETRSTFGLFADEARKTLWLCSNDTSGMGVPGPSTVTGSYLKGFDLETGEGKISAKLPGDKTLCNDITLDKDGTVYVTDSFATHILTLRPGTQELTVWTSDEQFTPPKNGAGLDGLAFGADGHLYVNTFSDGAFFRVAVNNGKPGKVTKLTTSRPITLPDGLRHLDGDRFLMVEGTDKFDALTIKGDDVMIETLQEGLLQPTAFAVHGTTAWIAEGQLSHLFDPKKNGPPKLPFHLVPVKINK